MKSTCRTWQENLSTHSYIIGPKKLRQIENDGKNEEKGGRRGKKTTADWTQNFQMSIAQTSNK